MRAPVVISLCDDEVPGGQLSLEDLLLSLTDLLSPLHHNPIGLLALQLSQP